MPLIDDPRLTSVLGEARVAYVSVDAAEGPHVTPELYAWSEGRLCFAAAAGTVKTNVLSKRPAAAAVVRTGTAAVVLAGEVVRPDPIAAARWMAGFAVRNAPDLLGFAADVVRGRAGGLVPQRRIVYGLVPDRAALLEGDRVTAAWGWDLGGDDATDVPPPIEGVPAVLAVDADGDGPVALPVRWDADGCEAWIPPGLAAVVDGGGAVRAALVVDDYGNPGPAAKTGVMLRGEASVSGCVARFDAERVTSWDGTETSTEPA